MSWPHGRGPGQAISGLAAVVLGELAVIVDSHTDGLLVDYCHQAGIDVVIRGIRNAGDLGYELPMVNANHYLTGIETLFIAADPSYSNVSSSLVTTATQRAR